jgi:transcriptional regulator with XRE-family HTH domain
MDIPKKKTRQGQHKPFNLCVIHLRKIRKSLNMNLEDIQAALDLDYGISIDRSNLGRIENGERTVSDIELVVLAHLLGVSVEKLLWGETPPKPDELGEILKKVQVRYATGRSRQSENS